MKNKESIKEKWLDHPISFYWPFIATVIACTAFIYAEIRTQTARTDKLYEMFIDLLKEGRNGK